MFQMRFSSPKNASEIIGICFVRGRNKHHNLSVGLTIQSESDHDIASVTRNIFIFSDQTCIICMQNDFTQIIYFLFHCFAGRDMKTGKKYIYITLKAMTVCIYETDCVSKVIEAKFKFFLFHKCSVQ